MNSFDHSKESEIEQLLDKSVGLEFFSSHFTEYKSWMKDLSTKVNNSKCKVITVAGTNGKGEVAFSLAHYLKENDKTFTLWSSPHILSVCERFLSHDGHISYSDLKSKIILKSQSIKIDLFNPSYYEFLFYLFIEWSLEKNPEYIVLEVGLGGRFDGVNVIDADIVALSSISREHTQVLGKTYKQILHEKLGVTRPGRVLFSAMHLKYLRSLTATFSNKNNINWTDIYTHFNLDSRISYSKSNQLLTKMVAQRIDLDIKNSPCSFGRGRFERFNACGAEFIFVGAHNLDGVRSFVEIWGEKADELLVAFSDRNVKEIEQICKIFSKIKDIKQVTYTSFDHPKALPPKVIKEVTNNLGLTFVDKWKAHLFTKKGQKILVSGSYYFIGKVQYALKEHS